MPEQKAPRKVAIATLGCKVNQYESQQILERFRALGFEPVADPEEADIYVVNTCAVTGEASQKSRHALRRGARTGNAIVVATGCLAHVEPGSLLKMPGVTLTLGHFEKEHLVEKVASYIQEVLKQPLPPVNPDVGCDNVIARGENPYERTRATLKLQDGCTLKCTYCIIPFSRPGNWLKPLEETLQEARQLVERGYREVVLTGIRLGAYRKLPRLITELACIEGLDRIRLSSIDPKDVSDDLIEVAAATPKVCRHFHLPLQCGDDSVLKAMRRRYTTGSFRTLVEKLRSRIPDVGITTDMMVGFPAETNECFENSFRFAAEMQFSKIHVFRYSARPGTAAADLGDAVPEQVKLARSKQLILLSAEGGRMFAESQVGKVLGVMIEEFDPQGGVASGLSDNYIRVSFEAVMARRGAIVPILIQNAVGESARGTVLTSDLCPQPTLSL